MAWRTRAKLRSQARPTYQPSVTEDYNAIDLRRFMMKKQTLSAFILIGLILAAAFAAQAQTTRPLVVNVPFDFVVGKKTLPAGQYTIKRLVRDNDKLLLVQSTDGRTAQSIQTSVVETNAATAAAQLKFHRYGDKYFLFQVWTPGTQTGRELPKSRLEQITIRELAQSNATRQQTVSVSGRLE
ncbi:MAG: hypothetical protein DMF64_09030 [Acidobacteria bacterium]|nr:MAG: hypothetical protein DMF64_09030 [Acidobacteriota bacterium]